MNTILLIEDNHEIREQMEFIEQDHALIKQDYNTYLSSLPIINCLDWPITHCAKGLQMH